MKYIKLSLYPGTTDEEAAKLARELPHVVQIIQLLGKHEGSETPLRHIEAVRLLDEEAS